MSAPVPGQDDVNPAPRGGRREVSEDWSYFNAAAERRARSSALPREPARLEAAEAGRRRMIGFGALALLLAAAIFLLVLAQERNRAAGLSAAGIELPALRIHPDDLARLGSGASATAAQRVAAQAEQTARADGAAGGAAPVVNYTIFQNVEYALGKVTTGWVFGSSEDRSPTSQFCYYVVVDGSKSVQHTVNLAAQPGVAYRYSEATSLGLSSAEWQDAASRCRWHDGRAPAT